MSGMICDDAGTMCDAVGRKHVAASGPVRIVSLVPSVTELICDLGLADRLVGRTGFCIHPATVLAQIPKIGGTKDVNIGKIRKLAPTHLIVNIDENEKPVVDLLASFIPHVIVTHPLVPQDNFALYRLLGGIFGVMARAEALCHELALAMQALPAMADSQTGSQTVIYCIWKDPWMTVSADTYIAGMLRLIGWNVWTPPHNPARYPEFDWSMLQVHPADRVLLSTEPYRFTAAHADHLQRELGMPAMLVDCEMLSWYGSRAIAGMDYLKKIQQVIPASESEN